MEKGERRAREREESGRNKNNRTARRREREELGREKGRENYGGGEK